MLTKRDYERELAEAVGLMSDRPSHTIEELDAIGTSLPISLMKNPHALAGYCYNHGLSVSDSQILMGWVVTQFPFLEKIHTKGLETYGEVSKIYDNVRVGFIIIHRLNYFVHTIMTMIYDVLEKDGRKKFKVKKSISDIERKWDANRHMHFADIERSAWSTFNDHLFLSYNAIAKNIDRVYVSVRDKMIRDGLRDVELKAWCQVLFLMGKVMGHSYKAYFLDFEKEYKIDFSKCFSNDDMYWMVEDFNGVCKLLGVETERDAYGYLCVKGVGEDYHFKKAWKELMDTIKNDDVMDQTAESAIGLNPDMQKEYHEIVAEKDKEMFAETLGWKYKVKKS